MCAFNGFKLRPLVGIAVKVCCRMAALSDQCYWWLSSNAKKAIEKIRLVILDRNSARDKLNLKVEIILSTMSHIITDGVINTIMTFTVTKPFSGQEKIFIYSL